MGWGHAGLMGQYILVDSMRGLFANNFYVASLVGFGSMIFYDQDVPMKSVTQFQEIMRENGWEVPEVLESIGRVMDEIARGFIDSDMPGGGGDRAEPESMSMASSSGSGSSRITNTRYLVNLLDNMDRTSMRQFFSSLPERTLNLNLARVGVETGTTTSRDDFLANLSSDVVNSILLELSDSDMQRFMTEIVLQTLRDTIASIPTTPPSSTPSGLTTATSMHWIY